MSKLISGMLANLFGNPHVQAAIKEVVASVIDVVVNVVRRIAVESLVIREVYRCNPSTYAHR